MRELTDFGKATVKDRYLLPGETPQDMYWRVAKAYAYNDAHARRMYHYMLNQWFSPSTPILSNGGTGIKASWWYRLYRLLKDRKPYGMPRGLPISCFLNSVDDNLASIAYKLVENLWISSRGGGIGTYWGDVRSVGEAISRKGVTTGIIPFIKIMESICMAISQGSIRRGSGAAYIRIDHPEIEEFIKGRDPSGDINRKFLQLHHGIVITDAFMEAVIDDKDWDLISPKDGRIIKTVKARYLFEQIIETRLKTGEPYIFFEGNANNSRKTKTQKLNKVKTSNLCNEITLPTGKDHRGRTRTAVCCLASVNIEHYEEWKDEKDFIYDCMLFLDGVLTSFIKLTKWQPLLWHARYSVKRERSIGLGVMGFHSYLQSKNIPFESSKALDFNEEFFKMFSEKADEANYRLAKLLGPCKDAKQAGEMIRNTYNTAIAPTASISAICGETSPCIEPWVTNYYLQKTLSGHFAIKNKYLVKLLKSMGKDTQEVWESISHNQGSVQHLDFLTHWQKEVFKTAFEIDQGRIIKLAGDRVKYINQGQSLNLFIKHGVHKSKLVLWHIMIFILKIKGAYYLRTMPAMNASIDQGVAKDNTLTREKFTIHDLKVVDSDDCNSCQ